MATETGISWCDSTFNPWIGCTKVSPGCDHCYAEALDKRMRFAGATHWGAGAERLRTSASNWAQPLKWQKQHLAFSTEHRRRRRVFCASLADVFDNEVPQAWRDDLWALIRSTPDLDWLILTKRIGNVKAMLPADWGSGYRNVWLGISVVNQDEVDRDVTKLIHTQARVRWLSCEPLLSRIDLCASFGMWFNTTMHCFESFNRERNRPGGMRGVDWVVVGGESGPNARSMLEDWVRSIRDQCEAANVAFFYKQKGGADRDKGGCLIDGTELKSWPRAA